MGKTFFDTETPLPPGWQIKEREREREKKIFNDNFLFTCHTNLEKIKKMKIDSVEKYI